MPNFCSSCGTKLSDTHARFCPECGKQMYGSSGNTEASESADWQVVVGNIPDIPNPTSSSGHQSQAKKSRPVKTAIAPEQSAPANAPSLVTASITQLLANGWGGLAGLSAMDPALQSKGLIMVGMALIAGISGMIAGKSRGIASKITLIASLVLVFMQGGAVLPQLLSMIDMGSLADPSNPIIAPLAGLGTSLAAAYMSLKRGK
jgi:hypothetical protein